MDKQTLKQKAVHEIREYLLIVLYLWLVFGLFVLYRSVILEHHISAAFHGLALINALALGKIMLIAKSVRRGKRFQDAPLIFPTLAYTAFFSVVLAIFKVIEDTAVGYFHGKSFSQSLADIGGGSWWGILSETLILFVLLIPFVAIGELEKVLGEGRLAQIFFGSSSRLAERLSSPSRHTQSKAS